jgi:transposase
VPMTGRNIEPEVDALSGGAGRCRRWTAAEKVAMVREPLESGVSVSLVVRPHRVDPSQLFHWRKLYQEGRLASVDVGESVVPASELAAALKRIRELERLLGRKTLENEILKEAVEVAGPESGVRARPCCPGTEN